MRIRYQTYCKQQAAQPQSPEEEDDDYEPEYQPMDTVDNTIEQADAISEAAAEPELLGPFVLPKPPPLTQEEARSLGCDAAGRLLDLMAAADPTPKQSSDKSQQQRGFARLAGSGSDRDYWAILLIRIATRATAPLEVQGEDSGADSQNGRAESETKPTIANSIRNRLFRYILEDFRSRISIGITWLTEEWYSGRIAMRSASDSLSGPRPPAPVMYEKWCLRLLDGIIPYLDSRDTKLFIRFVSEVPEITTSITSRMSSIAKDPERVNLCVQSLLYAVLLRLISRQLTSPLSYLIMYRPPAREMCLDTLENVYETCKFHVPHILLSSLTHKSKQTKNPAQQPSRSSLNGVLKSTRSPSNPNPSPLPPIPNQPRNKTNPLLSPTGPMPLPIQPNLSRSTSVNTRPRNHQPLPTPKIGRLTVDTDAYFKPATQLGRKTSVYAIIFCFYSISVSVISFPSMGLAS